MADISWDFELVDKATPAIKEIDGAMGKLPQSLAEVDAALKKVDNAAKLQSIARTKDPLKQLELGLKLQKSRLTEAAGAAGTHEKAIAKAGDASKSAGVSLETFGLGFAAKLATVAGLTELAVAGVKKLGSFAYDGITGLVKLGIESSEAKTAMLGALDVFEGGKSEAVFGTLQDMGIAVGLSADKAVKGFTDLRAAGFKAKEAQDILAASFDVAAQKGGGEGGAAAADKFQDLFVKFRALEKVGKKDILSLARDVGIAPEALAEGYAKRIGKSADAARKLLDDGKAGALDVSNALLDIVQAKFDKGGKLGDKAKELASGSVTLQLQRVKDLWGNLFEDAKIKPFAKAVEKLAESLGGPLGDKVKALTDKFFALFNFDAIDIDGPLNKAVDIASRLVDKSIEFGSGFRSAFDPQMVVGFHKSIDDFNKSLGVSSKSWSDIGASVGKFVTYLGIALEITMRIGEVVQKLAPHLAKFALTGGAANVADAGGWLGGKIAGFFGKGEQTAKGFAAGIAAGTPDVAAASKGMVQGSADAIVEKAEIRSPSKMTFRFGGYMAEGISEGWQSRDPMGDIGADVASFRPQLASASAAPAPDFASGQGRQISITFGDINIGGVAGGSPSDFAAAFTESAKEKMISFLTEASFA